MWKKTTQQQKLYCLELSLCIYIYIYIYNIHNIVHISSNMRVWRIYLEIASLAASRRIVLCIFFSLHTWTRMRENRRLRQAMGCPSGKKVGGGMNKIETSDVIGAVFYLHELIAYHWILALFFLSYLLWHLEKMTNKKHILLLECEEKLSNARPRGLQQILSLGSLAFKKIARRHMKTTI